MYVKIMFHLKASHGSRSMQCALAVDGNVKLTSEREMPSITGYYQLFIKFFTSYIKF